MCFTIVAPDRRGDGLLNRRVPSASISVFHAVTAIICPSGLASETRVQLRVVLRRIRQAGASLESVHAPLHAHA